MATEVHLPALGESVTEGTVTRWLKQVGDQVAVDEPLLEVSTDKVDTEIPSPVAGTLLEIKADEDDTVEVGAVLAVIGDEGESAGGAGGDDGAEAEPSPSGRSPTDQEADSRRGAQPRSPARGAGSAREPARGAAAPAAEQPSGVRRRRRDVGDPARRSASRSPRAPSPAG